jgi:hypothetical protein
MATARFRLSQLEACGGSMAIDRRISAPSGDRFATDPSYRTPVRSAPACSGSRSPLTSSRSRRPERGQDQLSWVGALAVRFASPARCRSGPSRASAFTIPLPRGSRLRWRVAIPSDRGRGPPQPPARTTMQDGAQLVLIARSREGRQDDGPDDCTTDAVCRIAVQSISHQRIIPASLTWCLELTYSRNPCSARLSGHGRRSQNRA